jgi:hypothetical protein
VTGWPVVGVDTGCVELHEADHLVRHLAAELALPGDTVACTHAVRAGARPHLAVSLTLPDQATAAAVWRRLRASVYGLSYGDLRSGPGPLADGAVHAAADPSGRAVLFPGTHALTGTLTVGRLLALSAVDAVTVLGEPGAPEADTPFDTRNHVRPERRDGRLLLRAAWSAGGVLAPFEVPNPTPCCADH